MNIKQLIEFLRRAREESGYEIIGEAKETVLQDGMRIIGPYTNGSLTYIDRYEGFEQFHGREAITLDDGLIWKRDYGGGITDNKYKEKTLALELFDVLKVALRMFPKDRPFRRGSFPLKINDRYFYSDHCKGDMTSFRGKEKIFCNFKEIYSLEYNGGVSTYTLDNICILNYNKSFIFWL